MIITKHTVSRTDSIHEGWPDIVRCKNGDLLVVYNECNAHTDRDHSRITMRKSYDNGKTWSEKKYISFETSHGKHWNSIRASVMPDGRIILVCDKMNGVGLTAESCHTCRIYMWESYDNGETFVNEHNTEIVGFCSDKVRRLSDGSLLLLVSLKNLESGLYEIHAHKSYDDGKTWHYRCCVASSSKYTFIEPNSIELNDGRIVAFLRENSMMGYNGFAVVSSDKGESFGEIFEIPTPGMHRPFVGRLFDGRLVLSFRELLGQGNYRRLMACIISENDIFNAKQFDTYHIDTDNHESHHDQGYSAWVQTAENEIYMVNYITDDAPKAYIRGYRITL